MIHSRTIRVVITATMILSMAGVFVIREVQAQVACTSNADCIGAGLTCVGATPQQQGRCNLPPPIWNAQLLPGAQPNASIFLQGTDALTSLRIGNLQFGFGNRINNVGAPGGEIALQFQSGSQGFTVYNGGQTSLLRVDNQGNVSIAQGLNVGTATGAVVGEIRASGDIRGNFVASDGTICNANQILKRSADGSAWRCAADDVQIGGGPGGQVVIPADVVRTTGNYPNPAWIPNFSWGKLINFPAPVNCPDNQFVRTVGIGGTEIICATPLLPPPAPAGLQGQGTAGQVAVWSGVDTLVAPAGLAFDTVTSNLTVGNDTSVGGNLAVTGTLNALSGTFSQNVTAGNVNAGGGLFSGVVSANGITAASGTFTGGLTVGNGLTVGGNITLSGAGATVDEVDLDTVLTGLTVGAGSGLTITGSGHTRALTLLGTCANGQVLQWNTGTSSWGCATIAVGPGGITEEVDPVFSTWFGGGAPPAPLSLSSLSVTGAVTASGCFGPTVVGATAATVNGNLNGAAAPNDGYRGIDALCAAEFAGSHQCETGEVMNSIHCGAIWTTSAKVTLQPNIPAGVFTWIANGAPSLPTPTNDCYGWTATGVVGGSQSQGIAWNFNVAGGGGYARACNLASRILCCR